MKHRRLALVALSGALAIPAAACGSTTTTSTPPAATATPGTVAAKVTVTDPWARSTVTGATTGAAYLTLTSTTDDALVDAQAPTSIAAQTQLHETTTGASDSMDTGTTMGTTGTSTNTGMAGIQAHDDDPGTTMAGSGEMGMREVDQIDLPAGQTVTLKPGGYHIMLIDLAKPLTNGETFELTLTFQKAPTQKVTVTVRDS